MKILVRLLALAILFFPNYLLAGDPLEGYRYEASGNCQVAPDIVLPCYKMSRENDDSEYYAILTNDGFIISIFQVKDGKISIIWKNPKYMQDVNKPSL